MTSTTYEKVNDIFNCKLKLENGNEFIIPMREDGYLYATGMCKVINKHVSAWLRLKETKEFIKALEKSDVIISTSKIIEIYKGGNMYKQGTWLHPDLGLNLAQWCSPSFSIQVSKWLKELIYTGKVEIGEEKNHTELSEHYKNIVEELNQTKQQLEQAENIIKSQDTENKYLLSQYKVLDSNHQSFLRRKKLYTLKKGACVYLVNMLGINEPEGTYKIKIGHTTDITNRIQGFRTSNPFCKILFLMYCPESFMIEKNMKVKYTKLRPNDSEFIDGILLDSLQDEIVHLAEFLDQPYTLADNNDINEFNNHIITANEAKEMQIVEPIDEKGQQLKRCGGITHTTEESRFLTLDNFYKNAGNRDGVNRLCKECHIQSTYGDKRKRRKIVAIPKYDTTTHKWCNLCETVKEHEMFYNDTGNKDGLGSNCKDCKKNQKIQHKNKIVKEQNIDDILEEKNIDIEKKYTRKDLIIIAKENNITKYSSLNKTEFINLLIKHNVPL
jgi:hypothetical protein